MDRIGYLKYFNYENTGFPIKTSGMTNKDFFKSLSCVGFMSVASVL